GRHVEVLGPHADEEVAHGPTHDEGEVSRALQLVARALGALADRVAVDGVLVLAVDDRARVLVGHAGAAPAAEQAVDEFLDHALFRLMMGHPRSLAWAASVGSGSTATGWSTFSSKGMSFSESL